MHSKIFKKMTNIEQDLNLFKKKIFGIYFWERIRGEVFKNIRLKLMDNIGVTTSDKGKISIYSKIIYRTIKNCLSKNPFVHNDADILCYGMGRRKRINNEWWDIYFDIVLENLNLDYVYMEDPGIGGHKKPPRTDNIKYTDMIKYSPKYVDKLGLNSISLSTPELRMLEKIETTIENIFKINIPIEDYVREKVSNRRVMLPLFKKLVRSVDPSLAIIVKSGRDIFIEACQELSVPVIELQHGHIGKYHPLYTFPGQDHIRRLIPDYLFTFGEYWSKNTEYPINQRKIKTVGFPFAEERCKKVSKTTAGHILFISQPPYSKLLSKYALELSKISEHQIIYKLHPNENKNSQETYTDLDNSRITLVTNETPSLYKLYSKSHTQVGVDSTALFEGAHFGLNTIAIAHPMSRLDSEIDAITVVDSTDELCHQINPDIQKHTVNESMFKVNAKDNIRAEINNILARE